MSRWFRFYDDALNDPKILKLSDKLHRVWVGILCVASKNDGQLPALDDMALMIRMKPEKLGEAIKSLAASGLIDTDGVISFPHNWDKRQFKSDVSTERVQRFRKQERNVSVTPPETEQIQIQIAAPAAPDQEVELFRRGKEILGKSAGGMIKQLLDAKDGKTNLARAAIETAAGKENPREYVGKIIRNQEPAAGEVSRYVDGRL